MGSIPNLERPSLANFQATSGEHIRHLDRPVDNRQQRFQMRRLEMLLDAKLHDASSPQIGYLAGSEANVPEQALPERVLGGRVMSHVPLFWH